MPDFNLCSFLIIIMKIEIQLLEAFLVRSIMHKVVLVTYISS